MQALRVFRQLKMHELLGQKGSSRWLVEFDTSGLHRARAPQLCKNIEGPLKESDREMCDEAEASLPSRALVFSPCVESGYVGLSMRFRKSHSTHAEHASASFFGCDRNTAERFLWQAPGCKPSQSSSRRAYLCEEQPFLSGKQIGCPLPDMTTGAPSQRNFKKAATVSHALCPACAFQRGALGLSLQRFSGGPHNSSKARRQGSAGGHVKNRSGRSAQS